MPIDLDLVDTIVIVMMENRSFDHLLGYRSLPPFDKPDVEGLRNDQAWLNQQANSANGVSCPPFHLTDPYSLMVGDPPHERDQIANQLGRDLGARFAMDGFVANYASAKGVPPLTAPTQAAVMGYFGADEAPITHFFAEHFTICDHWHAALPAGTQPNRLMAMSGTTRIDTNTFPLPEQPLVYDWLNERKIRWRVYHEDMPFFAMMLKWVPEIVGGGHFRPFAELYNDVQNESADEFPQVIFVEPTYTDAPHLGIASDDHAPSAIKGGQQFLQEVYRDITRIEDLWESALMIVTYDEHGGFFDHVSPPRGIITDPPAGYPPVAGQFTKGSFNTLGVRVPAFLISPFTTGGRSFRPTMDHTSILKLLGAKFGGGSYSPEVDRRQVASVADALEPPTLPHAAPIVPSLVPYMQQQAQAGGVLPGTQPQTDGQKAFFGGLDAIRTSPDRPAGAYQPLVSSFPPQGGTP